MVRPPLFHRRHRTPAILPRGPVSLSTPDIPFSRTVDPRHVRGFVSTHIPSASAGLDLAAPPPTRQQSPEHHELTSIIDSHPSGQAYDGELLRKMCLRAIYAIPPISKSCAMADSPTRLAARRTCKCDRSILCCKQVGLLD
ncbi:hypothetical protein K438DRAFT_1929833 [Mycena galopus ATCC 62051]|nr:hypothetical protein K438DRAFT_1929833 [Mycena galopus ATCC 62051]